MPNGIAGSAIEIPIPTGFAALNPVAMNRFGQVVGAMQNSAVSLPFLYTGGVVYDLSLVSGVLAGASPVAINDFGQIVFNVNGGIYLISPAPTVGVPPAGTIPITIASSISNQAFTVSGTNCSAGGYTTPQTLNWTPGASCTVSFLSPHSNQLGIQYVFSGWQDGAAANPRVIVAPAQSTTYTANFGLQYLLTGVANPPEGGTVTGGGWYDAYVYATLNAIPAAGYHLVDWSPIGSAPPGTTSPSMYMTYPQTETATFAPNTTGLGTTWAMRRSDCLMRAEGR
ncbi:MAG: hypothetical protein LAQ69_25185 [Acidobacteriia bacterium]|nr:hypothetical protein [Terriglobia bacterium]